MVLVGPSGCGKSTLLRAHFGAGVHNRGGAFTWATSGSTTCRPSSETRPWCFRAMPCIPICRCTTTWPLAYGAWPEQFGRTRLYQIAQPGQTFRTKRIKAETDSNRELERVLVASPWWEKLLVTATRRLPPGLRFVSDAERMVDERVRAVAKMLQIGPLLKPLSPVSSRVDKSSGWPWAGPWPAIPRYFLMDEPLSNLDAKLRMETRAQIVNSAATAGYLPPSTSPTTRWRP